MFDNIDFYIAFDLFVLLLKTVLLGTDSYEMNIT